MGTGGKKINVAHCRQTRARKEGSAPSQREEASRVVHVGLNDQCRHLRVSRSPEAPIPDPHSQFLLSLFCHSGLFFSLCSEVETTEEKETDRERDG